MQETQHPQGRIRWTTLVVGLAFVAAALVAGIVVVHDNRSGKSTVATTPANRVAFMEAACEHWMGAYPSSAQVPSGWCGSMAAWMTTQIEDGSMGSMMWSSSDQVRSACDAWVGTTHGNVSWCRAMSQWMTGQASRHGGWDGWMMEPSSD